MLKLKKIIQSLANDGKIFSNEKQFQIELAWAILHQLPDCEVYLESMIRPGIKEYTDIVVGLDGKYYPIELKNRLADRAIVYTIGEDSYYTNKQGATDEGTLYFVKDIERLERLKTEVFQGKTFGQGYAIIISNNPLFWKDDEEQSKKGNAAQSKEETRFQKGHSLTDEKYIPALYQYLAKEGKKQKVVLSKPYKIEWDDFYNSHEGWEYLSPNGNIIVVEEHGQKQRTKHPIRFLIVEVD